MTVEPDMAVSEPLLCLEEANRELAVRRFAVVKPQTESFQGLSLSTLLALQGEAPRPAVRSAILSSPIRTRRDALSVVNYLQEHPDDISLSRHLLCNLHSHLSAA